MTLKPGEKSGNNGGIYVEVGPRGGIKDNFATIAETKPRHQRNYRRKTDGQGDLGAKLGRAARRRV